MRHLTVAVLLAAVLPAFIAARAEALERPRVAAARATGPIRVDGVLDEPDWSRASPITDFRRILVREGETPSESTVVRVLFDDQALYFGIWCANHGPGAVRASLSPRDQILDGDQVMIHLDTYRDMRRAYVFGVNPYGVQADGILTGSDDPDLKWDAVWSAEARRAPDGWTAEVAIPLRALRFPEQGAGMWGLWVRREITKHDEVCSWPLWRREEQGDIMLQAGDLTGLEGLRGGGRIELQPYAASMQSEERSFAADGTGAPWSRSRENDVGLDLRSAVSTDLVFTGTLNPDFSQIEADALQIDVNQRFPLFYPEKRPFFLEGAEIFSTPINLVYTRRMADPAWGGKIAGAIGRLRVGGVVARDQGGGSHEGVGGGSSQGTMTRGYFQVGRASLDVGDNSSFGLLFAAHETDPERGLLSQDETPRPDGSGNLVLAGDARVRLGRSWFFTGQLAGSRSRADTAWVETLWDPAGVQLNWRTRSASNAGLAYLGNLRYADGTREAVLSQSYLGPEFRAETGFLERVDVRTSALYLGYTARPENRWLRSITPYTDNYVIHDHAGRLQERRSTLECEVNWQWQTYTGFEALHKVERWQGRDYPLNRGSFDIGNELWRPLEVWFEMEFGDGIYYGESDAESFKGWSEKYELSATARPTPRLTAELTAERERFAPGFRRGELFDVWALGAKTTFQFTRRLYTRLYPQYDTGEHHLDADGLLGYVVRPGTVFYLGVNGDLERVRGRHRQVQRSVFLKLSYNFQG